jgi:glycosyltransferase involved in cell wall biosynthesis
LLVDEHLALTNYLGLISAVDATVSPHRSEGFGYLPAYSLLLGTPTLVTNYSGPSDFCTEETSYPVAYDFTDIDAGDFVYDAQGAHWASINVGDLAKAMLQVRNDPGAARERATAGGDLLREKYSLSALSERYSDRLRCISGEGDADLSRHPSWSYEARVSMHTNSQRI